MPQKTGLPLAGTGFDRAAELRGNRQALTGLLQEGGGVLPVWRGKPLMQAASNGMRRLVFLAPDHPVLSEATDPPAFLGRRDGRGLFAADISAWQPEGDTATVGAFIDTSEQTHPALPESCGFAELRRTMALLPAPDGELAATAVGLFAWHRFHRFCANCGAPSAIAAAGWRRDCAACGRQHFPRTDPVVIMLVIHGNDLLIGRSHGWPEGMYSLLAGFMEPGETVEAAVRREVAEETGIRIGRVRYLASQPWPFPSSLMLGCLAQAESRAITIDDGEIEDARWISREQLLDDWANGRGGLIAARKGAIAHFLIRAWLSDRIGWGKTPPAARPGGPI